MELYFHLGNITFTNIQHLDTSEYGISYSTYDKTEIEDVELSLAYITPGNTFSIMN